jgi:hypothetical protein
MLLIVGIQFLVEVGELQTSDAAAANQAEAEDDSGDEEDKATSEVRIVQNCQLRSADVSMCSS